MTRNSLSQRMVLFCLLFAAFIVLPFSVPVPVAVAAQCAPPVGCEPPPYEPPPAQPPPSNSGGGAWSGYSDGRLNPEITEYYSVWCSLDQMEVWGGSPASQLLDAIPIRQVMDMTAPFATSTGLTVMRSGDTVTISGSNGNAAPSPGSKSFSLTACIVRNGGEPPAPEQPQPPPPESNPPPAAPGQAAAIGDVALCLPGTDSMADFLRCLLFFAPDDPSTDYLYVITWAVATFCAGGFAPLALIASVPAFRLWRRRGK